MEGPGESSAEPNESNKDQKREGSEEDIVGKATDKTVSNTRVPRDATFNPELKIR